VGSAHVAVRIVAGDVPALAEAVMVYYITRMTAGRRTLDALRFDAGSLSLNLVATVGRRFADPVERLSSIERLDHWLRSAGLDPSSEPTAEDLARFRHLREDLHTLLRHAVSGSRPPAAALARVNSAAVTHAPQLRATDDGLELARPSSPSRALDAILGLIAADAIRILVGSDRNALHACKAEDCGMLYLAHGRRARRWCSSAACGNRSRVAAHRARGRANEGQPS
jgi:predicted RNA-binding Zn ribbon-like protein